MHCRYCDIAYALPDPNCRGCGAPKTADAVRRGLDREMQSDRKSLASRDADAQRNGIISYLERLQRLGPAGMAAIVVTILGIVMILGPAGLIAMFIFLPKMMTAKSEWKNAELDRREAARREMHHFPQDRHGLEP